MQKDLNQYIEKFKATDKFGQLLGAKFVSLTEDECVFEYQPTSAHFNPNGILHGGALYGVMDSSQGMFVHQNLETEFQAAATGTATIKYLAPVTSGPIQISTKLKARQGRKIFVISKATDPSGKEVAILEEIWIAIPK